MLGAAILFLALAAGLAACYLLESLRLSRGGEQEPGTRRPAGGAPAPRRGRALATAADAPSAPRRDGHRGARTTRRPAAAARRPPRPRRARRRRARRARGRGARRPSAGRPARARGRDRLRRDAPLAAVVADDARRDRPGHPVHPDQALRAAVQAPAPGRALPPARRRRRRRAHRVAAHRPAPEAAPHRPRRPAGDARRRDAAVGAHAHRTRPGLGAVELRRAERHVLRELPRRLLPRDGRAHAALGGRVDPAPAGRRGRRRRRGDDLREPLRLQRLRPPPAVDPGPALQRRALRDGPRGRRARLRLRPAPDRDGRRAHAARAARDLPRAQDRTGAAGGWPRACCSWARWPRSRARRS